MAEQNRALLEAHGSKNPQPGHCHKCGLPLVTNPHPDAGKPDVYLQVGCPTECLPCLVASRHGWHSRAMKAETALRELTAQRTATAMQMPADEMKLAALLRAHRGAKSFGETVSTARAVLDFTEEHGDARAEEARREAAETKALLYVRTNLLELAKVEIAALREQLAQAGGDAVPLFWLSSQQVYGLNKIPGSYLPFQRETGGNFDFPVYDREPVVEVAAQADDDGRAEFEKLVQDNETHYSLANDVQRYHGGYVRHTVDIAWWAWKVGRAALRQPGALPDWIKIEGDATIIHGVRYSNALLEDFGKALPAGQPFLIESREKDGALCVTKLDWAVVDRPGALPDEAEKRPCLHHSSITRWSHLECEDCGAVLGDGSHGIAARIWFKSMAELNFYKQHGRLPEAAAKQAGKEAP